MCIKHNQIFRYNRLNYFTDGALKYVQMIQGDILLDMLLAIFFFFFKLILLIFIYTRKISTLYEFFIIFSGLIY